MPNKNDLTGYLFVLAAAAMWGLIGPICTYIFQEGISPMETAFWRAAFGWVFFLAHAKVKRQIRVQRSDLPVLLGFGLVCISVFYGSYQVAISEVGVGMASVLLYTAPAWVALLSLVVLGEAMTPAKLACVTMTIAGVGLISLGPQLLGGTGIQLGMLGLLTGLLSGFTYALYYIFGKKYLCHYATPTIFVYAMPVGALTILPFVTFAHKSPLAWGLLLLMAFITAYGAFSAYYAGLKRLEATRASVVATFEPMVAACLGFLLFGERFGPMGWAGSGLIIGAVLLVVMAGGTKATGAPVSRDPVEECQ